MTTFTDTAPSLSCHLRTTVTDFFLMKKAILLLIFLLTLGAWSANKYFARASKSNEEQERFQNYAGNYGHDANIFLTSQASLHHDKAFNLAYRMWKLSPISEIDFSSHYDEKTYYLALGKTLNDKAKAEGQFEARSALIDIGKFYGVTLPKKNIPVTPKTTLNKAHTSDTAKPSPLGKAILGDKRVIPSRHRRQNDR
jgi:hypothetical protein